MFPVSAQENFFASTFIDLFFLASNESFIIAGLDTEEDINEELPAL